MARYVEPLSTDFDGSPTTDFDDLVLNGLSDPRHLDRVPALTRIVRDDTATPRHRFQACIALTTWAERAGYLAVQSVATDPYEVPWRDVQLDRFFSVDNTFGFLASAVDTSSWIVDSKGTRVERGMALRALINIADKVNFDSKLTYALDPLAYNHLTDDVAATVRRGIDMLAGGHIPQFDLPTQLIDLTVSLIRHDEDLAVSLATELVQFAPSPRLLAHAVRIVEVGRTAASQTFSEYLTMVGNDDTRQRIATALSVRNKLM